MTVAEDKRKRLPCGHLLQPRYKNFCRICYNTKRRVRKLAEGFPWWAAEERAGSAGHIRAVAKWKKKNRSRALQHTKNGHQRRRELYGGDPSRNMEARFKWYEKKTEKATALKR